MNPPLPNPIQRDDTEHGVDYYTKAQLLAYRAAVIEECLSQYSPDDTANDWADKMKDLLK
jgi:hypothetical protein